MNPLPLVGPVFQTMEAAPRNAQEPELLAAAISGDEHAFRALVEPYRAELHAHCYRMLASVHDADDALQDALLRAWRGLAGFQGRSSLRTWLYRIATNSCLRALERRSRRELPVDHGPAADPGAPFDEPLVESTWVEPYPDGALAEGRVSPEARYEQRESVELAFIAGLQHLPANQRAALILRDVLGFSARETADSLEASEAAVNSALQRARDNLEARLPDRSQQATLRALGDERLTEIVRAYMDAFERADVDALVALLAEDATWSMPPAREWFAGHQAIARFLTGAPFRDSWRHLATGANGQLAVGCYAWRAERGRFEATVLDVLTLRGERIAAVTAFKTADAFARFGLPADVPG
jgi:RNA polymerase sigma-70 factor, ECF subfamily